MAGRYLGGQGAFFSLLKAALLVGKAEAVDSAPLGVQSQVCCFLAVFPRQSAQPFPQLLHL